MNHWLGRYLIKRSTWAALSFVVALALAFAGGARAADYSFGSGSSTGNSQVILLDWGTIVGLTPGDVMRVAGTAVAQSGTGVVGVQLGGGCSGGDQYLGISPAVAGAGAFDGTLTVPAGCTQARIYLYGASIEVSGGTVTVPYVAPTPTPAPTATATPTPAPTPDPMCQPYCEVALVAEDRARLDLLAENDLELGGMVSTSALVLSFLGAALVTVAGLRR